MSFKDLKFNADAYSKHTKKELLKELEYEFGKVNDLREILSSEKKKQGELISKIDGLRTLNKIIKKRLDYWISDFMSAKEAHTNLCVSNDLKLFN